MKLRIFTRSGGELKDYFKFVTTNFQAFLDWIPLNEYVAHDLETTYTDRLFDRKMLTAAFSYNNVTWVLFIEELTPEEMNKLIEVMKIGKFIVQGVKFEIKEWKKYGVQLERFYDTLLAEKLIQMGLEFAKNDLESILKKYIGIEISKDLQTSFVSNAEITDAQLKYAVIDVIHLHKVKALQEEFMANHDRELRKSFKIKKNRGLRKTHFWNQQFIKVIADMEYKGVLLDVPAWKKLYDKALPLVAKAEKELNSIVYRDFYNRAVAEGYIYDKDTFHPKLFTSSARKAKLLQILYPDIEKTAELELKKYLMKNDPDWPEGLKPTSKNMGKYLMFLNKTDPTYVPLKLLLLRRIEDVKKVFLANFRDKLIELELLIPKDTVSIKWSSPVQRMDIFHWIAPELESTQKEYLEEVAYKHDLIAYYLEYYQKYIGMVTKFGMNYLEHIEEDGRVRTNINPIINTGRMSSSKPNLLNIINNAEYRACFISSFGSKFVMTDYQSEELLLVAAFANEKLWLDAMEAGHDLHSINASKILESKWKMAELKDCKFAKTKGKCSCPEHKKLRSDSKQLSFGSLYGMSKFGMAFKLKVSEKEADNMLKGFFKAVPRIDKFLKGMSNFALNHLYSPELVLGACRFVDKKKIYYDKGSVMRTSANFAIQGAGASILKIACSLIWRHSKQMGHDATVVISPYDEIVLEVSDKYTDYWKSRLQYYMELAGKLALGSDLLKTDPCIVEDYWVH